MTPGTTFTVSLRQRTLVLGWLPRAIPTTFSRFDHVVEAKERGVLRVQRIRSIWGVRRCGGRGGTEFCYRERAEEERMKAAESGLAEEGEKDG